MMDCNKARRALWPPEKPKLAEADVLKAREHVEACVACRDYFDQDRYLLDAYDRMRLEPAPYRRQTGYFLHHDGQYQVSFRSPERGGRAFRIKSEHTCFLPGTAARTQREIRQAGRVRLPGRG